MDRIAAPISRNDRGTAVRNLQEGLILLLRASGPEASNVEHQAIVDRLVAEQRDGVYGDVTTEAVARFERDHRAAFGLRPGDGEQVDEPLAAAMNRLLQELGALVPGGPETFLITGRVEFEDGSPAVGMRVDVFDRDIGRRRAQLGNVEEPAITNEDGVFSAIRYGAREVEPGEGSSGPNADLVFEVTAEKDQSARRIVSLFRRFTRAGETTESRVADQVTSFDAAAVEDVRIVIERRPSENGLAEYARLMLALRPLLRERATPADFDQERCRDIDFSARETGWQRALVETMTQAWKLARAATPEPQLLAETCYGLLRRGAPTEVAPLAAETLSELLDRDARWRPKLEDSLVHRVIDGVLEEHLERLRDLRTDAAAKPSESRRGTIGDVLGHARLSVEDRRMLLAAYHAHEGTIEEFWREVVSKRLGWKEPKVRRAQLAVQLAEVLSNDMPLLGLVSARGVAEPRDLVKIDRADWVDLVKQVGPSPEAPGATSEEQITRTVDAITAVVAATYPTETLARFSATSRDPKLSAARDLLARFFERETASDDGTGFDFRTSPVTAYLETHGDRVFADLSSENKTLLTSQLQRLQRVYRLGVDPVQTEALLDLGLDSAFHVTRFSPEHFAAEFAEQLGGAERTSLVYGRAEKIAGTILYLYTELWQGLHAVQPAAIKGASEPEKIPALKEVPAYRALFGSLKLCECEHCQSFYSPAAYFVDLLHGLDTPGLGIKNPVEVLFRRRPDLAHIQLTCENTHTLIPYIDLVTEVLEAFVAEGVPTPFNVPPGAPHQRLPSPSADELRVNPVYLTADSAAFADQAYAALQEAVYPLSLPLNLPLETTRAYLEHLGVNRAELMKLFERDNALEIVMARAAEILRLSPEEFEIISGANFGAAGLGRPATVAELFGLSVTSDPNTEFNHAAPEFGVNAAKPDRRTALIRSLHNILDLILPVPIPVPGNHEYDAPTEAAVNAFLTSKGLAPNGRTDATFWGALEADGMPSLSVMLCPVAMFLERSGLTYAELLALVKTRFVNQTLQGEGDFDYLARLGIPAADVRAWIQAGLPTIPAAIEKAVLDAREDPVAFTKWVDRRTRSVVINTGFEAPCDLDRQTLMHLDGTLLAPEELVTLFRFIRLWRKLGWSIEELDLAIEPQALDDSAVFGTIRLLANLALLRDRTDAPMADLVVLWQTIPTHGEPTPYDRLFRNRAAQAIDPILELNRDRTELKAAADPTPPALSDHIGSLLAAFRLNAQDFELVRGALGLDDDPSLPPAARPQLSLEALSAIYRRVSLARALRISVRELLTLDALAGIDAVFERPDQTLGGHALALFDIVDKVRASGVKVAALDYLCRATPESVPGAQRAAWSRTLAELIDGLRAIASEDPIADDPSGEQLTARLTAIIGADGARATTDLVYGRDVYTARLIGLPASFTFPASVSSRISYDVPRKELKLRGAMTKTDRKDLLNVAGVPAGYAGAIRALADQPRAFTARALAAMFSAAEAEVALIDVPSLDATGQPNPAAIDSKIADVVARRRDLLSRSLIKQTLATATGLDADIVELLVENGDVLTSLGGVGAALADYQTLDGEGLDAQYFTDPDFTEPPALERVDETIGFDLEGKVPAPKIPATNFSVRWVGHLYVPATGEIGFRVRCTDGVQLTVNGLVMDERRDQAETEFNTTLRLDGGQFYPIEVLYYNKTGGALLELCWGSPAIVASVIPQSSLYTRARLDFLLQRIERMYKLALLLAPFELSARDLQRLSEQDEVVLDRMPVSEAPLAVAQPMFKEWLALFDFAALRDRYQAADVSLLDVPASATRAEATARFGTLSGAHPETVEAIVDAFTDRVFDTVSSKWETVEPDLTVLASWRRVAEALALVERTGAAPAQLLAWAKAREVDELPTGPETLWFTWTSADAAKNARGPNNARLAQQAKDLVRARYDDARWRTEGQKLNDVLRVRRRSALTGFVLALPKMMQARVTDTNRLFEFFLMDVEMGSCMPTSRIGQGIASLQLFYQRIFLDLESPEVPPARADRHQWEWRKNYRVWEANRKVFLYPESYVRSDLRDDKTPFFKKLESELLQDELNEPNAERAFRRYLENLDQVAKLIVCGSCVDSEKGILHVFGRTATTPFVFYHRTLDCSRGLSWPEGKWTPWQELPVDVATIEDGEDSGAHLLPIVWNRRLYLFWPLFKPAPDEAVNATLPEGFDQLDCWEIRLAWSEYKDGRWSPKKQGAHFVKSGPAVEATRETTSVSTPRTPNKVQRPGVWLQLEILGEPIPGARVEIPGKVEFLPLDTTDPMLDGVVLEDGDSARHDRTTTTTTCLSFLPKPRHHLFDVQVSRSSLSIRVLCRFRGTLKGKRTSVIEDTITIIRKGERTDRTNERLTSSSETGRSVDIFQLIGGFSFPNCSSEVSTFRTVQDLNYASLQRPDRTINSFMALSHERFALERATGPLHLPGAASPILSTVPTRFEVIDSDNRSGFDRTSPFFYQDQQRCYLVTRNAQSDTFDGPVVAETPLDERATATERAAGLSTTLDRKTGLPPDAALRANPWAQTALVKWAGGPGIQSALRPDGARDGLTPDDKVAQVAEKVHPEYTFTPHWHPYTCPFIGALNSGGLPALFTLENEAMTDAKLMNNFEFTYKPDRRRVVQPYPTESVDFSPTGSYSPYNWELFFHAPMLVANRLQSEGRHEEALRCYHYVYNPMTADADTSPQRAWRFLPFRKPETSSIEETLALLTYAGSDPVKLKERANLQASIQEWVDKPFNPHLIARLRPVAFKKAVVMQYLDNLIEWGDKLFLQDTRESVNEATQLYVLAANLLGPRPERVPAPGTVAPETYQSLRKRLDALSNAQVDLETRLPFTQLFGPGTGAIGQLTKLPQTLYFCLPQNDRLLAYWDTIADRLFKIRNCMSLDGTIRELPLIEPQIDPMVLVEAVAHGLDIGSVLNDRYAPLPRYRFSFMLQQALAMCNEVRSLGASLTSVVEKRDAERLAMLRAGHETQMLDQVKANKKLQIDQAEQSRQALDEAARMTTARMQYYEDLIAQGLIAEETDQLGNLQASNQEQEMASWVEASAQMLNLIPSTTTGTAAGTTFGGPHLGAAASAVGRSISSQAAASSYKASRASITGGHTRRAEDWRFQRDHAKRELNQITRQQTAARLGKEITQAELRNHETAIEHARGIEEFLRNKFTNERLYGWMEDRLRGTYFQCYKVAYERALRAQRCFQYELGTDATFVKYGAWDSSVRGLLAPETLHLQLTQMNCAYIEQQVNEFQITKQISVLQLDPLALIALKESGTCEIDVPEWLFDLDFPGHYFRRLKSVSVSIPAVIGPHTSINATVTLLSSKVRPLARIKGKYSDEDNYRTDNVPVNAIALSTGQNDTGQFQMDRGDEKYRPFEGGGAISRLRIELPKKFRSWDVETMSDVLLKYDFTARHDPLLAKHAEDALTEELKGATEGTLLRLFSLRHEFPNEWHNLKTAGKHTALITVSKDRFPPFAQGGKITVSELQVVLILNEPRPMVTYKAKLTLGTEPPIDVDWLSGSSELYRRAAKSNVVTIPVTAKAQDNGWQVQFAAPAGAANLDVIKDVLIVGRYSVVV